MTRQRWLGGIVLATKSFGCQGGAAAFAGDAADPPQGVTLADKLVLNLEELNLKDEADKPVRHAYRARVPGGWLVFTRIPGPSGLGGVTFYPDPNHTWDGGTQEG